MFYKCTRKASYTAFRLAAASEERCVCVCCAWVCRSQVYRGPGTPLRAVGQRASATWWQCRPSSSIDAAVLGKVRPSSRRSASRLTSNNCSSHCRSICNDSCGRPMTIDRWCNPIQCGHRHGSIHLARSSFVRPGEATLRRGNPDPRGLRPSTDSAHLNLSGVEGQILGRVKCVHVEPAAPSAAIFLLQSSGRSGLRLRVRVKPQDHRLSRSWEAHLETQTFVDALQQRFCAVGPEH